MSMVGTVGTSKICGKGLTSADCAAKPNTAHCSTTTASLK